MNRSRLILFLVLGISLVSGAAVLFIILSDPGNNPLENMNMNTWMPILISIIAAIIVAASMIPFLRILFPPRIKNGVTAEANVVEIHDTGVTVNDNPQVRLLLEVHPSMAAVFLSEVKTIVSRLEVGQVAPGTKVEVLYDPNDLKRIVVKSINLSSAPAGNTEARLAELNNLREKGLITGEEYQRKREEIIKLL